MICATIIGMVNPKWVNSLKLFSGFCAKMPAQGHMLVACSILCYTVLCYIYGFLYFIFCRDPLKAVGGSSLIAACGAQY